MSTQLTTTILMPGEYVFAQGQARVQTLLGSCVALVFWHPVKLIGGMSHIVLPSRPSRDKLDPRYADEFLQILIAEMEARNTRPQQYLARVYGAANMFRNLKATCADTVLKGEALCDSCINVSCRNRVAILAEARYYGLNVVETDLGGSGYRQVELDLRDGSTSVRTTQMPAPDTIKPGLIA
jgi:chemotaxis protein CheD